MITRPATAADARAIAELEERAWWRAYQDILDGQTLMELDADFRAARWKSLIESGDWLCFVAEAGGRVAGAVSAGASRETDSPAHEAELRAINVDPPAQGAGVGRVLMDVALQALRDAGYTHAVLRVFEANGHARGFYEGSGWDLVPGSQRVDELPAPVVLYRRAL